MTDIYLSLRTKAREIADRYPEPLFYRECADAINQSEQLFQAEPMLVELESLVAKEEDMRLGHGLDHSRKVTIDAGALIILEEHENEGKGPRFSRQVLLAHCAGLLHDIRRGKPEHAEKGARRAARVLESFPLTGVEVADICSAIGNHVAFKPPQPLKSPWGQLLSDALYDADKFRWGPDNFRYMLWDMVASFNPTLEDFLDRFPNGLAGVARIRDTFRTAVGRKYGPDFIDLGLAMGQEILEMIRREVLPDREKCDE